jgi:tetratricopeptide (TPR) repeat protein
MSNLTRAQLARRTGKIEEAIRILTDLLPRADRIYVENHRDLLTIYNNLLVYMLEANQLEAMPAVFARADAVGKRTGQEATIQMLAIAQLKGLHLLKTEHPEAAEAVFADIAAKRRVRFGRSAGLAADLLQLGRAKLTLKKYAEARVVLTEAEAMSIEKMSPVALPSIVIGSTLAEAQAEAGDPAAAMDTLNRIEPIVKAMPPNPLHPIVLRARAIVLLKQGRNGEALAALDQAERLFRGLGPAGLTYLKGMAALRARLAKAE